MQAFLWWTHRLHADHAETSQVEWGGLVSFSDFDDLMTTFGSTISIYYACIYIYIHIHSFIHPNYHSLGGLCYIWIKAGAILTWTTLALVCRRCFKCGKYCRRVFSPPDSTDDALNVVLAGSPCVVIFSDTQIINIYTVFDTYCINVSWEKGCVRFSGLLVVWIWTGTTRCNNQKSSGLFEEHQAESPTRSGAWECVGFPNRNRHRTTSRFHVNLNKICL